MSWYRPKNYLFTNFRDTSSWAWVYFARAGEFIKIGASSGVPPKVLERLASVQTGNPRQVKLWLAIRFHDWDSAYEAEKRLHRFFGRFRACGEWFVLTPEIIRFVRRQRYVEWRSARKS